MDSLAILFFSAFFAATVLPFYSEVALVVALREGADPLVLVAVATLGNTLGAVVNWALGLQILHFQDKRWFYFSKDQINKAQTWFQRRGVWSLLFAWMPIGGDALTLVAGIMRVRLSTFFVLVAIGKAIRYAFVAFIANMTL